MTVLKFTVLTFALETRGLILYNITIKSVEKSKTKQNENDLIVPCNVEWGSGGQTTSFGTWRSEVEVAVGFGTIRSLNSRKSEKMSRIRSSVLSNQSITLQNMAWTFSGGGSSSSFATSSWVMSSLFSFSCSLDEELTSSTVLFDFLLWKFIEFSFSEWCLGLEFNRRSDLQF